MASICVIEPWRLLLRDEDEQNHTSPIQDEGPTRLPLIGSLQAAGHDVAFQNLRAGNAEIPLGTVTWNGQRLNKIAAGVPWEQFDSAAYDIVGITSNFHLEQGIVCALIANLSARGARVVVGGSDAVAQPHVYLKAGADAVVLDKSGGSNAAVIEQVLTGKTDKPGYFFTKHGLYRSSVRYRLDPNAWSLPDETSFAGSLGRKWRATLPDVFPILSLPLDHGCDHDCDFCLTRNRGPYHLGYQAMTPRRADMWFAAAAKSGARSINVISDQYLGRVRFLPKNRDGRDELFDMHARMRTHGLSWMFRNGIELSKLTKGGGLPGGDPTPDTELIRAVCGWDGTSGCAQMFVPAERPVDGPERYSKLLPWQRHVAMLQEIVSAGVSDILYGVIIGLPEDSDVSLGALDTALGELKETLLAQNPALRFSINPTLLIPFPGIPLTEQLKREGLMPANPDPALVTKYTPIARTRYLTTGELSAWQRYLYRTHAEPGRWENRGATSFGT